MAAEDHSKMTAEYCAKHCNAVELRKEVTSLEKAIAADKEFTRPDPKKEPLAGTRGGDYHGVSIHSTRMPGRLAHHEVVFGTAGQTLTLRHDTLSRECFMPALLLAVKEVVNRQGLVIGLEEILGLH